MTAIKMLHQREVTRQAQVHMVYWIWLETLQNGSTTGTTKHITIPLCLKIHSGQQKATSVSYEVVHGMALQPASVQLIEAGIFLKVAQVTLDTAAQKVQLHHNSAHENVVKVR